MSICAVLYIGMRKCAISLHVLVCPPLHLGGYQYKCADAVDPRMKAIFLIMKVNL